MTSDTTNHLRILIQREMTERLNEAPENLIGRALNIAEYIVMHGALEATEEEIIAASRILEARGLLYLLETSVEEFPRYAAMIRNEVGPGYAFCIKCGRALKNANALKIGMGITCRAQINKGNWTIDRTNRSSTDTRRQEIAVNDALEMNNQDRLGLRRIALKYNISVSSVRIDRQINRRKDELIRMMMALIMDGEVPDEADDYPTISEPLIPPPPEPKKGKEKEDEDPVVTEMKALNVKEALNLVDTIEDRESMDIYLQAEMKGKKRKTVIKALEEKLSKYPEEDLGDTMNQDEPNEPGEEENVFGDGE